VGELADDHGFGTIIETSPDMVQEVLVDGRMPDIDRPEDLEALAARP
jgi:CTP:molybdopterin cytidylyltransferase MocA